jgi:hypothetical protein
VGGSRCGGGWKRACSLRAPVRRRRHQTEQVSRLAGKMGKELGCSLRMIFRISRNKKIDRYSDTIRREIEENIFTTIFKNLFLIYNNFKVCK